MTLNEVPPEVQSLSRIDKLGLTQLFTGECAKDDVVFIEPGRSYPISSPDRAFSSATLLRQALEEDRWPIVSIQAQ